MYKGKKDRKDIYFNELASVKYYEEIEYETYKILKVLKEDQRSTVKLIEIDSKKMILKVPTEKNKRRWQRIISIFRGGEASREFKSLEKIREVGLLGATPYFACERKVMGMTMDSYILMEYIEGEEGSLDTLLTVSKGLDEIHRKGYLHGDSQLVNFIIRDNKAYLIDAKLSKNIYGQIGRTYEYIYLERSCHKKIEVSNYNKDDIYYFIAIAYNKYLNFFRETRVRTKKKLRELLGIKKKEKNSEPKEKKSFFKKKSKESKEANEIKKDKKIFDINKYFKNKKTKEEEIDNEDTGNKA